MRMKREKLNIAMFGHKRIPSREGGIKIVVEELSKKLVQRGHSVSVYNRAGHHVSGKEFDNNKTTVACEKIKTVLNIERKGLATVTSSLFASLFAAVKKYDVVHIHAVGPAEFVGFRSCLGKK